MPTIHLLAPPNAPTTTASYLDGFVQLTRRAARLFTDIGYDVILYGAEANQAPCREFVPCISEEDRITLLEGKPYQDFRAVPDHPLSLAVNARMIVEVRKRKQARDLLLTIGGRAQAAVFDAHGDLMRVEYSVGYTGSMPRTRRVFESESHMHTTYAREQLLEGQFFDTVIPAFFNADDFPVSLAARPYVCYVGRIVEDKGIGIACRAAQLAKVGLKVAGFGDRNLVTYGEYLGPVSDEQKADIMRGAAAILCPTTYLEPFGSVAVEAQLCGTPAITSDFGGFRETVLDDVTGRRCHYMGEFVDAIKWALKGTPRAETAHRARKLYTLEAVAPLYREYFERLELLWADGFNHGATAPRVGGIGPSKATRTRAKKRRH